jgi:hypothetical protein
MQLQYLITFTETDGPQYCEVVYWWQSLQISACSNLQYLQCSVGGQGWQPLEVATSHQSESLNWGKGVQGWQLLKVLTTRCIVSPVIILSPAFEHSSGAL